MTIGQYLKPKNNILKLEVWDPDSEPGKWREGAKCGILIKAGDPVREINVETVTILDFYPAAVAPDLTKPEELFRDTYSIDRKLGKSITPPKISFSAETGRYTLIREFNTHDNFIEWPWTTSPILANPLPIEQMQKLQEAYQKIWQILSKKNLPAMRGAFHEMMSEAAMVGNYGSTEEIFFNSADLEQYFDDEFLKKFVLMSLDFKNRQLLFSLNGKIAQMQPPPPLIFCPPEYIGENFDIDRCYKFNPKFRFDGKAFMISW